MRDIILLTIVALFAPVALFRPVVGMLFFVWLGFFSPQSHTWGIARTLPLSQIAALATMAGLFLARETKGFPRCGEPMVSLAWWSGVGFSTLLRFFPVLPISDLVYI